MKQFFHTLVLLSIACFAAQAETVPAPLEPDTQYVIKIPKGGLKDFLKWHPTRVPLVSHHRGGPAPGFPENAIETMSNALRYGPGFMEVDVAQLADGTLILLHDKTLDRTTSGSGAASSKNWTDIAPLFLKDAGGKITRFKVPTLEETLKWAKGRAILTLDIKQSTDFRLVADTVRKAGAEDYSVVIAYTLAQAKAFHRIAPHMPISITVRNDHEIEAVRKSGIPSENIIAWTGTKELTPEIYSKIHQQGWRVIMGTLGRSDRAIDRQILASGNNARYLELFAAGVDVIATDRFWAVHSQIRNPNLFLFTKTSVRGDN